MNIATYFRMQAREFGGNLVSIDGDRQTTYSQLEENSNKVANWLKDTGIKPGERGIIYLPNCTEYFYFMYGALKAGIVAIPLNYRFRKGRAPLHIKGFRRGHYLHPESARGCHERAAKGRKRYSADSHCRWYGQENRDHLFADNPR